MAVGRTLDYRLCWPSAYTLEMTRESGRDPMVARIYKPERNAMQSGTAKTKQWVLDYEPEQPREIEPLMGWTSSSDLRSQVRLRFATGEGGGAYGEGHAV